MRTKEPIKEIIREHFGKNIILSIFTAIYLIKLNGFNKVLLAQQELGKSNFELIAFDGGAAVVYLVIAVLIVLVAAIFVVRDFLYLLMSFRGDGTADGGEVALTDSGWNSITAGTQLNLEVQAKMPQQTTGFDEPTNIAQVNYEIARID